MNKSHHHQRQGRVYYQNYSRTNTTNKKKFCGLLIAGFFVFMMVFGTNAWGDDKSKEVGIEQIGSTGALVKSYPMGDSGVTYSSSSGWQVNGAGAITRQTKHGVPLYISNDVYELNGVELVHGTGEIYHTKRESYQKIEFKNAGASNSHWIVTNKDGSKAYYGYDPDAVSYNSRILGVGKSDTQPRCWALAKVKAIQNASFARYIYDVGSVSTNGDYYLEKIISGMTGASAYKATLLEYEAKEKTAVVSYRSGSKVKINDRLKIVRVKLGTDINGSGGNLVNKHVVTWGNPDMKGFKLIDNIYLYGTDGDTGGDPFPPIKFEYKQAEKKFNGATWLGAIGNWVRTTQDGFTYTDLVDMNGDGLPDMVKRNSTDSMSVAINNISYCDLLEKEINQNGGELIYTYKPSTGQQISISNYFGICNSVYYTETETYDYVLMQSPLILKFWCVQSITTDDGMNAGSYSTATTSYDYSGFYYDVPDREARGFETVLTTDPTGNKKETHYHQDDVLKGLVRKSMTRDSSNNIYDFVYNTYEDHCTVASHSTHYGYGISGVHAPLLKQVDTYVVDGSTTDGDGSSPGGTYKHIQTKMFYDDPISPTAKEYGDLYKIENHGDLDLAYDKKITTFAYARNPTTWVVVPSQKVVSGYNNTTWGEQLKEEYYYDGTLDSATSWLALGSVNTGHLKRLCTYKDSSNSIDTRRLAYDAYGNVATVLDPNGKPTTTLYDTKYRMFPVKTTLPTVSAGTFSSYNYYDYYTETTNTGTISNNITRGRPSMVRDINGQYTKTYYDNLSRVTDIRKPGDESGDPTIHYDYHFYTGSSDPSYMKTTLKDGLGGLVSYAYSDGLGRTVQAKKEAIEGDSTAKWATVDSWSYFDSGNHYAISETIAPYFSASSAFDRNTSPTGGRTKTVSYLSSTDGRVAWVETPDGNDSYTYSKRFVTTSRNAKNFGGTSTADGLGNVIEAKAYSDTYPYGSLYRTDKMYYNTGTGQLVKKIEDSGGQNITTTMTYDYLGRNISTVDPDKGTWNYYYDSYNGYTSIGNLIAQKDAKDQTVSMTYDALNRVKYKETSAYDGNKSIAMYTYDTGTNGKGRLGKVNDGSKCWTNYYYDARGRTTKEEKTIDYISQDGGVQPYVTDWTYDSMDRVDTTTYPHDGTSREVIKHTYNSGGNLEKLGTTSNDDKYVKNINYDAFGRIKYKLYGNDVINDYNYYGASDNYRLYQMQAVNGSGAMIDNLYDYDDVGNITVINSFVDDQYDQWFTYDFLNRLKAQTFPFFTGGPTSYTYDEINRIITKTGISGDYQYGAGSAGPHAVTRTGSSSYTYYTYDTNGNMITKGSNTFSFNADNLLVKSVVGGNTEQYDYDHAGNRKMKGEFYRVGDVTGDGYVNMGDFGVLCQHVSYGQPLRGAPSLKTGTFYVSPLYEEEWEDRRVDGGTGTCTGKIKYYYANGQRIAKNDNGTLSFYHSDHLGGSSRITNESGSQIYELGYMPYGSDAYSSGSGDEPYYKFTGKEQDATGLYYYGARYYDPALGRFISPDAYGDNYVYCNNNPMMYVDPDGNNPVLMAAMAIGGVSIFCGAVTYGMIEGMGYLGADPEDVDRGQEISLWFVDAGLIPFMFTKKIVADGAAKYGKARIAASTAENVAWGGVVSAGVQEYKGNYSAEKTTVDAASYGWFGAALEYAKRHTDNLPKTKIGRLKNAVTASALFAPTGYIQAKYREYSNADFGIRYGIGRPFAIFKNYFFPANKPYFQETQTLLRVGLSYIMEYAPTAKELEAKYFNKSGNNNSGNSSSGGSYTYWYGTYPQEMTHTDLGGGKGLIEVK